MTLTRPVETEQTIMIGQPWNGLYRDRYSYERDTILEEAVRAWRLNPLARRLTNLYKIYNVDGISFKCDDPNTEKFLQTFWTHDLNQFEEMLEEISNEIFLTGNLFPLFSVDASGMTYVRIFPTDQIAEIKTANNDIRQEIAYITKPLNMDVEPQTFINPRGLPSVSVSNFMQHYTINKLAGTAWGEGEIWPDLPWLGRYASFLEDRVRLNRYRQAYMYDVALTGTDSEKVKSRKNELRNNPPQPGSVNVHDESEKWSVIAPNLSSGEAERDGLTLKKMIAVNHAPMHYLAEPESSTRTTADAAGTPAFKAFEDNQRIFKRVIHKILTIAAKRRAEKDSKVKADAKIEVRSADATERDNAALALATGQIVSAIGEMYDRKLLDESEYLRLVYRFAGETMPAGVAPKGIRKPLEKPANTNQGGLKTDAETGEVKEPK